jgi:nitrate reductase gamma subunit
VLGAVVLLGLVATVGVQVFGAGHDYRQSVAVWWRGIFLFQPDPTLMVGTPLVLQLHTIVALGLLAIWPFTRLVHAWAVVIGILWQPSKTRPRPSSALDS